VSNLNAFAISKKRVPVRTTVNVLGQLLNLESFLEVDPGLEPAEAFTVTFLPTAE
jgi:hypothetical protein